MSLFQEIPTNSEEVLQVLDELIRLPRGFRPDTLRKRKWTVLPGVGQATGLDTWLVDALSSYEVERLLVLFKGIDSNDIHQAGWLRPSLEGMRFLDKTSTGLCHLAVAPDKDIAWWQFYTDDYYMAGDISFIEAAHCNSFRTLLEYYLEQARAIDAQDTSRHMTRFCRRYEEFFPSNMSCDMALPDAITINKNLVEVDIPLPADLRRLIVRNKSVRLLNKDTLEQRAWRCIMLPVIPECGKGGLDWAREAERIALAAAQLRASKLLGFVCGDDGVETSYSALITRDSILAFRNLSNDNDILITTDTKDFVMLGSAGYFFLVAGDLDFISAVIRDDFTSTLSIQDANLTFIEGVAPQIGSILSEAMIGYLELL